MEKKKLYRSVSTKLDYADAGKLMTIAGRKGLRISAYLRELIMREIKNCEEKK